MFSKSKSGTLIVDRRDVLRGLAAAAASCAVVATNTAFALENADGTDPMVPFGQKSCIEFDGSVVDASALEAGDFIVVKKDDAFIGILHRTDEQMAAAATEVADSKFPEADGDRVQNARYLVVNLECPHRGFMMAYSADNVAEPFSCQKHDSTFDASGRVVSGKALNTGNLVVPEYSIDEAMITFA